MYLIAARCDLWLNIDRYRRTTVLPKFWRGSTDRPSTFQTSALYTSTSLTLQATVSDLIIEWYLPTCCLNICLTLFLALMSQHLRAWYAVPWTKAVLHLPTKFGADIFIQYAYIESTLFSQFEITNARFFTYRMHFQPPNYSVNK